MPRLRGFLLRLHNLFRSRTANSEIDAELESHLALHINDGIRAGLSPEKARREALVKLGGAEQTRQAWRERATLPWLDTLARDVRYALRGFARNPVFAITAILTLALGIGATTAVFSVVDRILFRPLPYAQGNRIVSFGLSQPLEQEEFNLGFFFFDWRDQQRPFSSVTYERGVGECNLTEQNPVQMRCGEVAANFLSTFGVIPVLGRGFKSEEDQPHGPQAAMLSYSLWLSRYNRDPGVLNKTVEIDGAPVRIVGVLPPNFEMPRLQQVDILEPARVDISQQHTVNSGLGVPLWAFGRLKPGVSVAQAREEMEPLFRHTQQFIPAQFRQDFHLEVRSVRDRQMHDAYRAAWILLAAVLAVLLIACANVAGLFAARGAARERELAVRAALGASRGRIMRQMLTDALLLALAGAGAGCALAWLLLRVFVAVAPTGVPFLADARLDMRAMAAAILLALGSAVFFGVISALQQPRAAALTARRSQSRRHARMRRLLVTVQIAASVVLLTGASLMAHSFRNLTAQQLGMATSHVLAVRPSLTWARYTSAQAYMDFYLRIEAALRGLPGVTAVGISDSIPPDDGKWHGSCRYPDLVVSGRPPAPAGVGGTVFTRDVTPDYFKALGIPIVLGRTFSEAERKETSGEMILSRKLASMLFPEEDAIGKHIQSATYMPYYQLTGPVYTVVGIAGDVKNAGLAGGDEPELYTLRRNRPDDWNSHDVLEVQTGLPPSVVDPWIRSMIARIDPTAPVEIEPIAETVQRLADRPRFEAALLSFFALIGLVLAAIGLYGVLAFIAAQRTQEIGIRMALGASRSQILRLIAGEGARLIVLGAAVGIVVAFFATRLLTTLLFHVQADDPVTFAAVILFLAVVALAATLAPARRAMKTDPMEALRTE
jgi:putative ABC transport system permease protein